MKKFKNYLFPAAGFVILVGSLVLTSPSTGQSQGRGQGPQDVRVVNRPANPVPTTAQGTTTIAGTVQAQQSGSWDVGITGTPTFNLASGSSVGIDPSNNTVRLESSALDPVSVRNINDAREPFQNEVILAFSPGLNGAFEAFLVPAGKRLVIEHVSGLAALENGQKLRYSRILTLAVAGGDDSNHYLETTPQGSVPGTADYFVISQPMRVYAVGAVQIAAFRTDTVGFGQVNVTISGYLADVP